MNLTQINKDLAHKSPEQIIAWALDYAKRPVLTTNFGPQSASLLHAVSKQNPDIPVLWVDTGYNTRFTYEHALLTIAQLKLNVHTYVPKQSVAYRNVVLGIPEPDTPEHQLFTEQVKLEPFARAMQEHQPDLWFANLRKGQTAFRDGLEIVNQGQDGVLKVCPFLNWNDEEIEDYLLSHNLQSEDRYYDPTKVLANRECGLHTQ